MLFWKILKAGVLEIFIQLYGRSKILVSSTEHFKPDIVIFNGLSRIANAAKNVLFYKNLGRKGVRVIPAAVGRDVKS